jgi:hypothetical protein
MRPEGPNRQVVLALFSIGVLASCEASPSLVEDDAGGGVDAASPGLDAAGHDAPAAPDAWIAPTDRTTITFGPDPLDVGRERTVCVIVDVGNDVARQVSAIRTHLPQGSHHMILYRTDEPVRAEPLTCTPFADGEAIFIAETREAELVFPADAALAFDAHQHVRIEVHEVNYLGMPIDVMASATFDFLPLDAPPRTEVQLLFTGDLTLSLPPHETTTVRSFHVPDSGARIFALTSHTHSLGTYASIEDADDLTDTTGTLLHESRSWADPPLDLFDPPITLAPGRGLRLTCTYENTRDDWVFFGLNFDEEMCFLWAYWY